MNGIECHHLAFRAEKVDWQVWVQAGDTPLPMKYLIISKMGDRRASVRDPVPELEHQAADQGRPIQFLGSGWGQEARRYPRQRGR